jgi:hypothetical protein
MPQLLTAEQQQWRMSACQEPLYESGMTKNYLLIIITGEKIWVYCYNPETKQQSSQWKSQSSLRP